MEILKPLIEQTSLNCDEDSDPLNLMAFTYVFSIIYQLVTRKIGRNLAMAANFLPFLQSRIGNLVQQYDQGHGHKVDQAMLIQMESVADLLQGQNGSSISSSTSGSVNTSLDDWSEGSDEEPEEASEEMQVAQDWLVNEFRLTKK